MRARNIKPGFYINEDLAECSIWARHLAPGLWCIADREGRLEDRPKRIKGEIFRFDNVDVEQLLQELHIHKHILRYEINGIKYIQILKFKEHQSPHYSEKESIIPSPFRDVSEKIASSSNDIPGTLPENPLIKRGSQPPDSLNPDSLIVSSNDENKKNSARMKIPPDGFDAFWSLFPRQRIGNREKVEAAYRQALKRGTAGEILSGLKSYVDSDEVQKGFAKGAAAWLNDDRWRNDYTTTPQGGNYAKPTFRSEGQRLAARYRQDAEREEQSAIDGNP